MLAVVHLGNLGTAVDLFNLRTVPVRMILGQMLILLQQLSLVKKNLTEQIILLV